MIAIFFGAAIASPWIDAVWSSASRRKYFPIHLRRTLPTHLGHSRVRGTFEQSPGLAVVHILTTLSERIIRIRTLRPRNDQPAHDVLTLFP